MGTRISDGPNRRKGLPVSLVRVVGVCRTRDDWCSVGEPFGLTCAGSHRVYHRRCLGLSLGIASGLFALADKLVDPTLQMLRTIPFLAITPLLILWFGIDERPKIIIIAAAALFPLYINTHSGVRNVDRKVIEAGRVFGLRGLGLIRQVILPEMIPSVLVGLRVSLSVSLLALIVAELSNAPKGLGFLMTSAQQYFQTDVLVVVVIIYAIWGLSVDLLVRGIERILMPYKQWGKSA